MSPQKARNEPNQLLAKQLSSIGTTLAQAAKRRESDLRMMASRNPTPVLSTPMANNCLIDLANPTNNTNKTEAGGCIVSKIGALDLMVKSGLFVNLTPPLDYKVDSQSLASSTQPELDRSVCTEDESVEPVVEPNGTITNEDDSLQPTTIPDQTLFVSTVEGSLLMDKNNTMRLKGDLDQLERSVTEGSPPEAMDANNMLEGFEKTPQAFTPTPTRGDPRQMLADLERNACSLKQRAKVSTPSHDDLHELRGMLSDLFSVRQVNKPSFPEPYKLETDFKDVPSCPSPKTVGAAITHYGATLQIGKAGCDTENIMVHSRSSFRPDEDKDLQEKEAYVQKCENNLKHQIQQAIFGHQAAKGIRKMDCRIVVTNIAADAELYDLALVFGKFDAQGYFILEERNPTNGTKAAYIDFYTKQSSWEASHIHESIFGLKLRVRLATEVFDKSPRGS